MEERTQSIKAKTLRDAPNLDSRSVIASLGFAKKNFIRQLIKERDLQALITLTSSHRLETTHLDLPQAQMKYFHFDS